MFLPDNVYFQLIVLSLQAMVLFTPLGGTAFLAMYPDAAVHQGRRGVKHTNMNEGKQFVHSLLSRILNKSLPVRFINATIHAVTIWSTYGLRASPLHNPHRVALLVPWLS